MYFINAKFYNFYNYNKIIIKFTLIKVEKYYQFESMSYIDILSIAGIRSYDN